MSHRRDIGQKTGAADVVDGLAQGQRHRLVAQRGKGGDHPLPVRLPQGHRADRGRHQCADEGVQEQLRALCHGQPLRRAGRAKGDGQRQIGEAMPPDVIDHPHKSRALLGHLGQPL